MAKTDRLYLLLADGNVVATTGTSPSMVYMTDKKMVRMVRFGTQIIGVNKDGKLFYAVRSGTNTWTWTPLRSYPKDVSFINSTNTGNNLEVVTCGGKAFLYTYSSDWQNGTPTSVRKTHLHRYYGNDTSVWIDIDPQTDCGKTNTGAKYKHVKAAGFYSTGNIVTVTTRDTFTHVRIIDNNAYFLFSQD